MADDPVFELENDQLPAFERKRRAGSDPASLEDTQSTSVSEMVPTPASTQSQNIGLRTPPATPHRSKKRVRLSGTGPSSSSTGLTPILSRSSLSSRSNFSPNYSTGLEQTLQFVRSQDIADRGKRAQRRGVLSEITQEILSKKRLEEENAYLKAINHPGTESHVPDSTDGVFDVKMDTDNVLPQQDNLFDAAKFGRTLEVTMFLKRGDDPNQVRDGLTPVMLAVMGKHKPVLKALLGLQQLRTDIHGRDGGTVFTYAIKTGDEEVVQLLLGDKRTDPNFPNRDGDTALFCAMQLRLTGIVKLFLKSRRVHVNTKNARGQTALWSAALSNHIAMFDLLLGDYLVEVNTRDEGGCTLLCFLASKGKHDMVESLLQRKDLAVNETTNRLTPLMIAARGGYEAVVELLLRRDDIRTDLKDGDNNKLGWTALVYAAERGVEAVVRLLVGKDTADVDNALQRAASNGNDAIVQLLLKHGVSAEAVDLALRTASNTISPHAGHEVVIWVLSGR